jgi:hypothetical protein
MKSEWKMSSKPTPIAPYPYPLTQEMTELEREDFEIIAQKIRPLEKAPKYIRIGVPMFMGMVAFILYFVGELTWMFVFFVMFGAMVILISELGLRQYMAQLKKDLALRQKRIWKGTLTGSFHRQPGQSRRKSTPRTSGYIWMVNEKEFRVAQEDFKIATKGDQVEIEQLPESDLVLRVRRITVWE